MYFYLSDRGNTYNEDFVFVTEKFGVLLDGATGLYNEKIACGNTDAQIFSHHVGRLLCENIDNLSMSLPDIILECLKEVHQTYFSMITDLEDKRLPSATLSCFRRNGKKIEMISLGDSPLIVKTKKECHVYQDDILGKNEAEAIKELSLAWEETQNFDQAKERIRPLLKKFRESKNTKGGYKVLDFSGKGLIGSQVVTYDYQEIEAILLVSDGVYRLVDTFHLYTEEELLLAIADYSKSLLLVDKLRQLEHEENSLKEYPRLKLSDDATLGLWRRGKES